MYNIIDNFLPEDEFNNLKTMLSSMGFPWYYHDFTHVPEDNMPRFIHDFFIINGWIGGQPVSQYADIMYPVFSHIENFSSILRCKANLTLRQSENIEVGFHTDTEQPFNGNTAILYLNDTDGGTKFENGDIVECKANRFVTFDNRISHSAITCTDQNRRMVINFNYTTWAEE